MFSWLEVMEYLIYIELLSVLAWRLHQPIACNQEWFEWMSILHGRNPKVTTNKNTANNTKGQNHKLQNLWVNPYHPMEWIHQTKTTIMVRPSPQTPWRIPSQTSTTGIYQNCKKTARETQNHMALCSPNRFRKRGYIHKQNPRFEPRDRSSQWQSLLDSYVLARNLSQWRKRCWWCPVQIDHIIEYWTIIKNTTRHFRFVSQDYHLVSTIIFLISQKKMFIFTKLHSQIMWTVLMNSDKGDYYGN